MIFVIFYFPIPFHWTVVLHTPSHSGPPAPSPLTHSPPPPSQPLAPGDVLEMLQAVGGGVRGRGNSRGKSTWETPEAQGADDVSTTWVNGEREVEEVRGGATTFPSTHI